MRPGQTGTERDRSKVSIPRRVDRPLRHSVRGTERLTTVKCLNPPKGRPAFATRLIAPAPCYEGCLNPPKGRPAFATASGTAYQPQGARTCLNPPKGRPVFATVTTDQPTDPKKRSQSPEGSTGLCDVAPDLCVEREVSQSPEGSTGLCDDAKSFDGSQVRTTMSQSPDGSTGLCDQSSLFRRSRCSMSQSPEGSTGLCD